MNESTSIKVKVCGMRDMPNIADIAALRPDYLGFIFYPKSPRFVGEHFSLDKEITGNSLRVGVFVDAGTSFIQEMIVRHHLHCVQLHGNETPADVRNIRKSGVEVWKVFSVGDNVDFDMTLPYEEYADKFLFDTKGKHHGGNGVAFEWNVLDKYHQRVPFWLSGGLNDTNIGNLSSLRGMNLFGVDLNSGVEESPGLKDAGKVQTLIEEVRLTKL